MWTETATATARPASNWETSPVHCSPTAAASADEPASARQTPAGVASPSQPADAQPCSSSPLSSPSSHPAPPAGSAAAGATASTPAASVSSSPVPLCVQPSRRPPAQQGKLTDGTGRSARSHIGSTCCIVAGREQNTAAGCRTESARSSTQPKR